MSGLALYRVQWVAPGGQLQWHVCRTLEQARALAGAIGLREFRPGSIRVCLIDDPEAFVGVSL